MIQFDVHLPINAHIRLPFQTIFGNPEFSDSLLEKYEKIHGYYDV